MADLSHYFDYAAATPVDPIVIAAMQPYWHDQFYNPSAPYLAAKQVAQDIEMARKTVASIIGVRSPEIVFTAGGTEADNLAINGIMQNFPNSHLIVSSIEHDAVLKAAQQYQNDLVPVDENGRVIVDAIEQLITDDTVLVSVMHANNEIGTVQPLLRISKVVQAVRTKRRQDGNKTPLYFHTDASQSANYLDIHVHRLGVDMMTLNGGKIYGPKQSGALFVATGVQLQPTQIGGGQERGLRSGTEHAAGIVGFATALELAQSKCRDESDRIGKLRRQFLQNLSKAVPSAVVNGDNTLSNFVHITIPGVDNERLVMELDEVGIQCAMGSACSASSDEPSHVLTAMGRSDAEARSSLRFTMGRGTTEAAVKDVIQQLKTHIA